MKFSLQILFLITSLTSFAQKQLVVDSDAEIREITGSYTSIKVSNAINLYLSKGDVEAIAISADEEKFKQGIKTEIENGTLNIFYDGPSIWSRRNKKLNVYVSYKLLEQITATSASNVWVVGNMQLPLLNIKLSGASDFKGQLNAHDMNVKLSGASDMKLSGTVTNLNIECTGASDFKGYNFISQTCNVNASGASDVNITVSKEITANASGASNVQYKGTNLHIKKSSRGASSIKNVD